MLEARIRVVEGRRKTFAPGFVEAPEKLKFTVLIVLTSGRLPYVINGHTAELRPGSTLLVPVGVWRRFEVPMEAPADYSWFRLRCTPAEPALQNGYFGRCTDPLLEVAAIQRLRALCGSPGPGSLLAAEGEAKAILGRVVPSMWPVAGDAAPEPPPRRGNAAINHAVRYLNERFAERDALANALRNAPFSANHFRRLFREQVGLPPQAFLTQRRMQHARDVLETTDATVQAAASAAGYADPLHFSRAYRRFWGRPPSRDRSRSWTGPAAP